MTGVTVAAVDLGASGGRVMAGQVSDSGITLHEVHRFPNEPVAAGGTLYWDILRLYADVRHGLEAAARQFPLASAGIDSWGVDFGLLDEAGALLGNPVHYRDARTTGVPDRVHAALPAAELYGVTGIQQLPFNTIYQLAATPMLPHAATILLIPDLLAYWLTGEAGAEVTNASTTSLLDVRTQAWATQVIEKAGLPPRIFPPLRRPGEVIGPILEPNGLGSPLPVIAVASHDTASAVAAVPAKGPGFAYISSGTWSLAGMELDAPVLTTASRAANFTNETGIDGTVRYLRNLTGLWLLQQSLRCWPGQSLDDLLAEAARSPGCGSSSTLMTLCSCRRVTFRGGSPGGWPTGARPSRPGRPRRCAASWTAWRWDTGARSPRRSHCLGGTRTWCTSSAAGPATSCCASSRPTLPGCR